MNVRAPIHGRTLSWAREALGLDITELAVSLNVAEAQVQKWEAEEAFPTVVQLRKVAKKLDRTPAFFFIPPPDDTGIPPTPDFRGRQEEKLPPALLREIKRADSYRATYLDLVGSEEMSRLPKPFGRNDVVARARDLHAAMGTRATGPLTGNAADVFARWRTALEDLGFLVFQTTGIDTATFRGLSVHHTAYPVILLNGADSTYGKVFTLFHEVGHILNRSSGVCMVLDNNDTEALCNAFSAEVLMPTARIQQFLRRNDDPNVIEAISAYFKVSELAAAVRLKALGMIDHDSLEATRQASDSRWNDARRRQSDREGFVPHWRLRYRDLGPRYVGTVLNALETDRIDALDASYMLQAKIPTLERMQQEFHRRSDA